MWAGPSGQFGDLLLLRLSACADLLCAPAHPCTVRGRTFWEDVLGRGGGMAAASALRRESPQAPGPGAELHGNCPQLQIEPLSPITADDVKINRQGNLLSRSRPGQFSPRKGPITFTIVIRFPGEKHNLPLILLFRRAWCL